MKDNGFISQVRIVVAGACVFASATLLAGPAASLEFKWDVSGRDVPEPQVADVTNTDEMEVCWPFWACSIGFNYDTFPAGLILYLR